MSSTLAKRTPSTTTSSTIAPSTPAPPSTPTPPVTTSKSIYGDETPPIMASPAVSSKGTTNGQSNGNTPQPHIDELVVASPVSSPKPVVVTKSRNATNVHGSTEVAESRSTVSRTETHATLSRSQSRTTTITDSGVARFTSEQQVLVLRDSVTSTRSRFISDLEHVNGHYIDSTTIESFLEYIENQRLTHMPHHGSRWDKVLKWAEFYAVQIASYQTAISPFVQESKAAAQLILVACRVLLELGPENAQALETTFGVFYKLGLSLSFFLRHAKLLSRSAHIRMEVGQAFNDMLLLVNDVAIYYRVTASSSFAGHFDFNVKFGRHMDAFYRRKNHITDAMWDHQLENNASIDIRTVRKWLSTRDTTIQGILNDRLSARGQRDEYTCEWFQRQLLDFSRGKDNVFAITGPSGCGKSVLAGWIIERLQRPLGRKTHATLSYMIEADIPSESTSLAIVKNLVLQLLETNVGDSRLFNALAHAHQLSLDSQETKTIEEALWKSLDVGLDGVEKSGPLMIVIDGLDQVRGGAFTFNAVSKTLGDLAEKHPGVQAVILSGSAPQLSNIKTVRLEITADHTHKDIHHVAKHVLHKCSQFHNQLEKTREAIVEQFANAAKGNFLWLILSGQVLSKETNLQRFMEKLDVLKKLSLSDVINEIIKSVDFTKSDTKLLLSWLLVAERPLHVREVQSLLEIDIQKVKLVTRNSDIQDHIVQSCASLVRTRNGIVSFRHGTIRAHLTEVQTKGKELLIATAAQTDLTMRALAYSKVILTKTYEPAFSAIDIVDVDDLFHQHSLLEYTVRNWLRHFQNSSLHKAGTLELSPEFKALFPTSVHLALIEWACWEKQTSTYEAITMHELSLKIREGVFTEKHNSVLQTIIVCGSLHRKVSHTNDAARYFFRASRIGQSILSKYSPITVTCTTAFLTVTELIRSTTRTELVTWKEEMLKYVIDASEHKYGKNSDAVIRWYNVLAELYDEIHEESHAEEAWRQLREIFRAKYGKGSKPEQRIPLIVPKGPGKQNTNTIKEIFDTMEGDEWDESRSKITINLAEAYEASGELFKAEELYVTLWRGMMEHSHRDRRQLGVDSHISLIDIALNYVYFLRRCNRQEDAGGILICLWTEYGEYEFESETLIKRLKSVGELMRTVSLLSIAVSVFRKCLSWFKAHGKHEEYASVEILVSETIQAITASTTITTTADSTVTSTATSTAIQSTTVATSTTTTTTTESVIREVFESTVSKTTVTSETISVCRSLISYYEKLEQWSEAIAASERSLTLIWKSITSGGGTTALPREFSSEAIKIAISLATYHLSAHHYHEAEEIYVRIYRACWNSCNIHDERLSSACDTLIKFYKEHHHWQKMIEIYQEILVEYRRNLGPSHALTIKTLYTLAALCLEHGHGDSYKYYEEIITVLNGKSKVCHPDAEKAMIIVCREYYESGQWEKLKITCEVLWHTWTHHHREHKFESSFIEALYARYIYVLEHHYHSEYEVVRSITVAYRDTCVAAFGASVDITVKSLMELAQVSMRSEKYVQEAIKYYEEIIKTTTTTTTTTVISITTIKAKLTSAYIHVCSKGSTSTEIIERATKVVTERFDHLRSTFGYSHSETLTVLRELVLLHIRVKNVKVVQQLLQSSTVEIIKKEKSSKSLYEAAKTLSSIYLSSGLVEFGQTIIYEMRRQIISKVFTGADKYGFKIDSAGKSSYVFLVTFEQHINGKATLSYSEIMAELLTEAVLYESYTRSIKSGTSIDITLISTARYWAYLSKHSRTEEVKAVEDHVYKIFIEKWGKSIKTSQEITLIFYRSLLEELSRVSRTLSIGSAACAAGSHKVRILLEQQKYQEAYAVASCAFQFIKQENAYHEISNIGHGFKLSGYLVGRGLDTENFAKGIEPTLHAEMVKLSQAIIRDVLDECKKIKIDFVHLKLGELNDLVGLLGAQGNFVDLEWLLESLWSSREVQKNWTAETIIAIGKRYVQSRLLGNHGPAAIRLCEDICYNLRRVWGDLDPKVLEMSELLSQVYTKANRFADAMGVHEEILRLVVEGDDDDDKTIDEMEADRARFHLDLLKRSYQRLGKWDKSPKVYKELVDQLLAMPVYKNDPNFKGVQSTDKWSVKEELSPAAQALGTFTPPDKWEFVGKNLLTENGDLIAAGRRSNGNGTSSGHLAPGNRVGLGMKRASSNWGMQLIHKYLIGEEPEE